MGLPQIPPSETDEKVAPVAAVLHGSPQFSDASPSNMNNMNSVSICGLDVYPLESSFDDFINYRGAMEVTSNVYSLQIGCTDRSGCFASRTGRSIHVPASRVVGFESGQTSSLTETGVPATNIRSSAFTNVEVNDTEPAISLVRKRLLSPLSSMLSPSHFKGDPLDICCRNNEIGSLVKNDNFRNSIAQDKKKANIGSKNSCTMPSWSLSSCLDPKNVPCSNGSFSLIDGPLLENRRLLSQSSCSPTAGIDHFRESGEVRFQSGTISISPKKVSSPLLSLSPLGPKFSERIKTAGGCRNAVDKQLQYNFKEYREITCQI